VDWRGLSLRQCSTKIELWAKSHVDYIAKYVYILLVLCIVETTWIVDSWKGGGGRVIWIGGRIYP
jgi:hypothetical protein